MLLVTHDGTSLDNNTEILVSFYFPAATAVINRNTVQKARLHLEQQSYPALGKQS